MQRNSVAGEILRPRFGLAVQARYHSPLARFPARSLPGTRRPPLRHPLLATRHPLLAARRSPRRELTGRTQPMHHSAERQPEQQHASVHA
jgi:hypothetical protein